MALPVNLLLSVKGKMVTVFSNHNMRQKSRRGQAPVQQALRQGRDHGRAIQFGFVNILSANDSAAQKTARLVIELFADLLANHAPLLRLRLHRLRINHFLHHRQVLGQPQRPFFA